MSSLVDRFNNRAATPDDLEARAAQLAGVGIATIPTPVHEKAIDVLQKLMTMGADLADDDTPVQLRVLMRGLVTMRPMLIEMFSKVPPATIVHFFRVLRDDLQTIIDTEPEDAPLPSEHDDADTSEADRPA